jgi:hypothetical protein
MWNYTSECNRMEQILKLEESYVPEAAHLIRHWPAWKGRANMYVTQSTFKQQLNSLQEHVLSSVYGKMWSLTVVLKVYSVKTDQSDFMCFFTFRLSYVSLFLIATRCLFVSYIRLYIRVLQLLLLTNHADFPVNICQRRVVVPPRTI